MHLRFCPPCHMFSTKPPDYIAMFDELKLPSMMKNQKVMVAEVVYLLGACATG